jgi:serine/threonine-protein kinase RsbW
VTGDEIRLVIPAEEGFRPIAHLVAGGLALRLDVTYDDLEDLQVAIEECLGLRDDAGEVTVVLAADGGVVRASVGPLPAGARDEEAPARPVGLGLARVLETVCDTHEFEHRDDGLWVELTKRITSVAGAGA